MIAFATKILDISYEKIPGCERNHLENQLTFIGFIVI